MYIMYIEILLYKGGFRDHGVVGFTLPVKYC